MSSKLPVLFTGLPVGHAALPSHIDQTKLKAALDKVEAELAASPYDGEAYFIGPEVPDSKWIDKLKEKDWRAVVIGFGVRGNPGLTEFFEKLVNLTRIHAPNAVFCFNSSPDSTLASIERNLPAQ